MDLDVHLERGEKKESEEKQEGKGEGVIDMK